MERGTLGQNLVAFSADKKGVVTRVLTQHVPGRKLRRHAALTELLDGPKTVHQTGGLIIPGGVQFFISLTARAQPVFTLLNIMLPAAPDATSSNRRWRAI